MIKAHILQYFAGLARNNKIRSFPMYDFTAQKKVLEVPQLSDALYTIEKLGPSKGLINGAIFSFLVWLPLITLVIWF